jgi:L-asparaginase
MRHLTLITTGGTIEKTYDEQTGQLLNRRSIVHRMLRRLRLEDTKVNVIELMSKDSLDMTAEDRLRIEQTVRTELASNPSAIVILHGTDTLCTTGDHLHAALPNPPVPIILTGAMRPYEMTRSDALQNLTEAIFAAGLLKPAVYVAAHGRTLRFPGVQKDRSRGTFVTAL